MRVDTTPGLTATHTHHVATTQVRAQRGRDTLRKRGFSRTGGSGEGEAQLGTELYAPEVSSPRRPPGKCGKTSRR